MAPLISSEPDLCRAIDHDIKRGVQESETERQRRLINSYMRLGIGNRNPGELYAEWETDARYFLTGKMNFNHNFVFIGFGDILILLQARR